MQPEDIFVVTPHGEVRRRAARVCAPLCADGSWRARAQLVAAKSPAPARGLKQSQCTPLFFNAYKMRGAGACIHTHDQHAVMVTLLWDKEFRITHQEMIKGIKGHRFYDELVVPIIENTAEERDLAERMAEAMRLYPHSHAVLVRRHGVYVWGDTWQQAKTMTECYSYLFEVALKMRAAGLDPGAVPADSEYRHLVSSRGSQPRAAASE